MKNKKGFTLVELVIVIAIVGILAALLVPMMMGYVKKARLRQCNANAKVAYNVVTGVQGQKLIDGDDYHIDDVEIDLRGAEPIPNDELGRMIYHSIAANAKNSGIMYIGTRGKDDSGDDLLYVQWIMKPGDTMVGQYPNASNDVNHVPTWKTYKDD
ncbi:type II secretion system protein [uncultured Ruminococcus sp.]|uniref:type II secretion system protein n=1 Tax=uncultured Ruminococcus sp. TaxID=165186 RepID=UPI000EBAADEF|nr:prepilin-type N-terminal cleavage/methylation domain-containing protein [uncultured Ruminococcus sp.]HCJ41867.1 prepilin-type cleavage/methylation domain-containing protein [Ruminococcus sp.]